MRATSLAIISAAWICTRAYGGESAGWTLAEQLSKLGDVVAADSPITGPLTELLVRSFGPRQIIAEQLAGLPGIERVFLFGSWAARYAGHPDRAPPDIDVLVIGNPDRDQLDEAAQRAGSRLAREVNVTVRSAQWWRGSGDGFHAEVAMRPLIPVFSDGGPQ
jgi:predicted nucleotidyltransferase